MSACNQKFRARRAAALTVSSLATLILLATSIQASWADSPPTTNSSITLKSLSDGSVTPLAAQSSRQQQGTALNGGDSGTLAVVQAGNPAPSVLDVSLYDPDNPETSAILSARSTGVSLSWAAVPGVTSYEVLRDEVLLTTTDQLSLFDPAVSSGVEYRYSIRSITPESYVPPSESTSASTFWFFSIKIPASTSPEAVQDVVDERLAATAARSSTQVNYQTFIPQKYLNAPPAGCSYGNGYQFGGDDRSYQASGYPYRTRLNANINWTSSAALSVTKNVGSTNVYKNGSKVATKTASTSDMSISKLALSNSTLVDLRFNLKAKNPFCTMNSIQAAFTMRVTRSGSYRISSGQHRLMPNHEIYVGDGRWTTVYRRGYQNATCLVSMACPLAEMSASGTYS